MSGSGRFAEAPGAAVVPGDASAGMPSLPHLPQHQIPQGRNPDGVAVVVDDDRARDGETHQQAHRVAGLHFA